MSHFEQELSRHLDRVREQGLYRRLRTVEGAQGTRIRVAGQTLLNFASNDYLGLANDPALKNEAVRIVQEFGAGAGASRLVCGSLTPHRQLDETIAEFKSTPAALSFATGYAAALGAITALLGRDDVIILDKVVHACIVDAARLSGAKLRVFRHNDLNALEEILKWAGRRKAATPSGSANSRRLIVTESVFSMDGDHAPLREIVGLKEKYGAWLMVDEAHATGLYGAHRRGLAEELGVSDRIEIQMGTLGKALGAAGGYICGSQTLVDCLVNGARSFIFSTAPVPAAAAAATAGIRFVQSPAGEQRRKRLWRRVSELVPGPSALASAIVPIVLGEEALAVETAATLQRQGFFVPAIRYPAVARGKARLRLTLTASHTAEEVALLAAALSGLHLAARTAAAPPVETSPAHP